jgi:hypothetical protein
MPTLCKNVGNDEADGLGYRMLGLQPKQPSNDAVHLATANNVDFRTSAARGSGASNCASAPYGLKANRTLTT